jgi:hypothetical protein
MFILSLVFQVVCKYTFFFKAHLFFQKNVKSCNFALKNKTKYNLDTNIYKDLPQVAQLAQSLKPGSAVRLKGLSGSSPALLAMALMQRRQSNHIFILPDNESASYFQNDLANILGDDRAFYFPS